MPGSRVRVPPLLSTGQSPTGGWLDFLLGTLPRTVPSSSHFSASSAAGEQHGLDVEGARGVPSEAVATPKKRIGFDAEASDDGDRGRESVRRCRLQCCWK